MAQTVLLIAILNPVFMKLKTQYQNSAVFSYLLQNSVMLCHKSYDDKSNVL